MKKASLNSIKPIEFLHLAIRVLPPWTKPKHETWDEELFYSKQVKEFCKTRGLDIHDLVFSGKVRPPLTSTEWRECVPAIIEEQNKKIGKRKEGPPSKAKERLAIEAKNNKLKSREIHDKKKRYKILARQFNKRPRTIENIIERIHTPAEDINPLIPDYLR